MALKLNKQLSKGIVALECYAKIIEARYYNNDPFGPKGIDITVAFYYSPDARAQDERAYIETNNYIISDTTIEKRADQYEYLKTLPDFAGAVDS